MSAPPTNFQPYDRVTGAQLSPQQQRACRPYYYIIKAYIDGFGAGAGEGSPISWMPTALRCSTAELLESMETLADTIRHRKEKDFIDGTSSIESWGRAEGVTVLALEPQELDEHAATKRYRHAVNLLHEFVARFSDGRSDIYRTLKLPESPAFEAQKLDQLDNHTDMKAQRSHGTSTIPREAPWLPDTMVSAASDEPASTSIDLEATDRLPSDRGEILSDRAHNANRRVIVPFIVSGAIFPRVPGTKVETGPDWALEYLRGGWSSKSPTNIDGMFDSPVPSVSREPPFGNSLSIMHNTSPDSSVTSADDAPRSLQSISAGPRNVRQSHPSARPIPTMAARLKTMVKSSISHANEGESLDSDSEFFRTPRSILSGNSIFATPEAEHSPHELYPDIM